MSQAIVIELNELQELHKELEQKADHCDSTVRKVQLWGTLIGTVIAALIVWAADISPVVVLGVTFGLLFLGSFGYEARDAIYNEAHDASNKQDKLARELIENELQGKIVKHNYGYLFGDTLQEFTIQLDEVVSDYFIRVEKPTGKVWAYPKTPAMH